MTPAETAQKLATIYGGINAAANACTVSRVTFTRILSGRMVPSDALARYLAKCLGRAEEAQG